MSQGHYSDQAASIKVNRDKNNNEIPVDQPMHTEATAGEGAFNFGGGQYAQDFKSYGVNVTDLGQTPSVDRGANNSQTTGRGKES
jgi:hypothetical protein